MINKIVGFKGAYRNFPFPQHDDFCLLDNTAQDDHSATAYIQTSVKGIIKQSHHQQYDYITKQNKKILVLEQPVFRKNLNINNIDAFYYRLGLWHYSYNKGYFKNTNSPKDRWQIIQKDQDIEIKPWRNKGDYILIVLQNPIDTSLNSLIRKYNTYSQWLDTIIHQIRIITTEPIVIRKHPGFTKTKRFDNLHYLVDKYTNVSFSKNINNGSITNGGENLYRDFSLARLVIGYTSNSLVESVCEGIPTITLSDEGFSYPVSYKCIDRESLCSKICYIDRTQWLYDCSYTQWKMSEINDGIPHRRLLNES